MASTSMPNTKKVFDNLHMLWGYVYGYILITIPPLLLRRILGTPWQPTTVLGDGDGQCFRLILHGYYININHLSCV